MIIILRRRFLLICFIAVIGLVGCTKKGGDSISVGSKDFTESYILAELYSLALEKEGFVVERKFNLGGTNVAHAAMTKGELDIYPEYTGTCLINVLNQEPMSDPEEIFKYVSEQYKDQFELVLLKPSEANNSQGLAISKKISDKFGIKTISDLQAKAENVRFASQGAFEENSDGMPALTKTYGEFLFKSVDFFDNAIKYELIKEDQADLIVAFTTDGQLVDPAFVLLEDDKHAWTMYNIVPIVRQDILEANPKIEEILNSVSNALDTKIMQELNAEVDINKEEPEDVAYKFYEKTFQ